MEENLENSRYVMEGGSSRYGSSSLTDENNSKYNFNPYKVSNDFTGSCYYNSHPTVNNQDYYNNYSGVKMSTWSTNNVDDKCGRYPGNNNKPTVLPCGEGNVATSQIGAQREGYLSHLSSPNNQCCRSPYYASNSPLAYGSTNGEQSSSPHHPHHYNGVAPDLNSMTSSCNGFDFGGAKWDTLL
ncbi:hypothetical protein LSTR_LSTR011330 [Laodelphax striatellus]|uniref:Uncharacterized protein n=1 Tax=Laodelphax striatellus TaxID=195883 RepID=A0A482WGX6_LAOST|nr:hypothetical protein LSTR_LSTR011330 [Laodelphax striatellus]